MRASDRQGGHQNFKKARLSRPASPTFAYFFPDHAIAGANHD